MWRHQRNDDIVVRVDEKNYVGLCWWSTQYHDSQPHTRVTKYKNKSHAHKIKQAYHYQTAMRKSKYWNYEISQISWPVDQPSLKFQHSFVIASGAYISIQKRGFIGWTQIKPCREDERRMKYGQKIQLRQGWNEIWPRNACSARLVPRHQKPGSMSVQLVLLCLWNIDLFPQCPKQCREQDWWKNQSNVKKGPPRIQQTWTTTSVLQRRIRHHWHPLTFFEHRK